MFKKGLKDNLTINNKNNMENTNLNEILNYIQKNNIRKLIIYLGIVKKINVDPINDNESDISIDDFDMNIDDF